MEIDLEVKTNFSELIVTIDDGFGKIKNIAFMGRWLFQEVQEEHDLRYAGIDYSVAITERNNFFVFCEYLGVRASLDSFTYLIYDSFEEMVDRDLIPPCVLSAVADKLGLEYEIFLRI